MEIIRKGINGSLLPRRQQDKSLLTVTPHQSNSPFQFQVLQNNPYFSLQHLAHVNKLFAFIFIPIEV